MCLAWHDGCHNLCDLFIHIESTTAHFYMTEKGNSQMEKCWGNIVIDFYVFYHIVTSLKHNFYLNFLNIDVWPQVSLISILYLIKLQFWLGAVLMQNSVWKSIFFLGSQSGQHSVPGSCKSHSSFLRQRQWTRGKEYLATMSLYNNRLAILR